ncbi:MAG: ferredoxin family protein [Planctomycetaceae bacterium]|nr:MAG: ferredoxin family protein [Planctomycetaceae bacterium]
MILPAIPTVLTVVVSRGQSRNPEKRGMESAITEAAAALPGVAVLDVPHLYDLKAADESIRTLRAIEGDLVVASWLFPRAAHWLLDRLDVRGQVGETAFDPEPDEDEEPAAEASEATDPRVIEMFPRSGRTIRCLDMRAADADRLNAEIRRIVEETAHGLDRSGDGQTDHASNGHAEPGNGQSREPWEGDAAQRVPLRLDETVTRRWYPVIDYSRCTNCMECIDFCLFGVYGIDGAETILVEQPDNCRKGCPACSRVCPAGAIIFPQHKAPAIAGAPVDGDEGFKIDLSLLFGAPDQTADPVAVAARERDEQLLLAGRAAVGLPDTRSRSKSKPAPPDRLDLLIDELDQAEL